MVSFSPSICSKKNFKNRLNQTGPTTHQTKQFFPRIGQCRGEISKDQLGRIGSKSGEKPTELISSLGEESAYLFRKWIDGSL